jgi:hypothetical protein
VFVDGQMGQEAVNVRFRHLPWMLVLVELEVPANPMQAGLLRAAAVVANPQNLDDAVVEPWQRLIGEQAQRLSSVLSGGGHHGHLATDSWA